MNQEKRDIVNSRLKDIFCGEIDTLYFSNYDGENIFERSPFKDLSLIDSIIECLRLNEDNCSANSRTKSVETGEDCNRSVIDIWRHLKYYNSELTIFEVMSCLYNYIMNETEYDYKISTFICSDIRRRVFILKDHRFYVTDKSVNDSLHINFHDWNNI